MIVAVFAPGGRLVALSDAQWTVVGGVAVAAIGAFSVIIAAMLQREAKTRDKTVDEKTETVVQQIVDFEAAYKRRTELLDGLGADLDAAHRRIAYLEDRDDVCQDELAAAVARIAKLEAAVGRRGRRA